MQWATLLVVFLSAIQTVYTFSTQSWTTERRHYYRAQVKELWQHGYDSYMSYAFPTDELAPLSCFGRGPNWDDPSDYGTNDVAANVTLTLIDVLDSLAIMGEHDDFEQAVRDVIQFVSFDVDTKPQVFEITIRALGGLLSAHILAKEEKYGHNLDWYNDELLVLAYDLGRRLLPAFNTPTSLPFARINLRRGIMANETTETCVAGAGSLILEFGALSRLSGDVRFEKAARKAFFALWERRSEIGLVGNGIEIISGKWTRTESTGIGAGVDSFYEYALKWYILTGDPEFLHVWEETYGSVTRYARAADGYSYRIIGMHKGFALSANVDSLSAFWAGLQVLGGDIEGAIKSHLYYYNLWRKYHAIPELWDASTKEPVVSTYPLRPEFIESTYYLYQATGDQFYLDVGAQVYHDIFARAKVSCGLAGMADIGNGRLDDRMESFVLSETLKYLYLLFDEENEVVGRKNGGSWIWTTEGHFLEFNDYQRKLFPMELKGNKTDLTCPRAYEAGTEPGLAHGIKHRSDYEYARQLVGLNINGDTARADEAWWYPDGSCETPTVEIYQYDFLLSRAGVQAKEDDNVESLKEKLWRLETGGLLIQEVIGLRVSVRSRYDGKGFDITKVGHLDVKQGEMLYINDSLLFGPKNGNDTSPTEKKRRARTVPLKFFTIMDTDPVLYTNTPDGTSDNLKSATGGTAVTSEFVVEASTADFGLDLDVLRLSSSPDETNVEKAMLNGAHLVRTADNRLGCSPYNNTGQLTNSLIYVERGDCLFIEKLYHARRAGALGVIVWHNGEESLNPSAEPEDLDAWGAEVDGGVVAVIPASAAAFVSGRLNLEEQDGGKNRVMVKVEREWPDQLLGEDPSLRPEPSKTESKRTGGGILYINGHPMINTELIF